MHITSSWRKPLVGICAAALAVPLALGTGVASAAPATPAKAQTAGPLTPAVGPQAATAGSAGAYISSIPGVGGPGNQTLNFNVFSPAMNRNVPMQVLVPPGFFLGNGQQYPVLYQLDGLRADPDITDWARKADTQAFFGNKNVLVVQPIGGYASFYQNWDKRDQGIVDKSNSTINPTASGGELHWETFLTGELPGLIDDIFQGNGKRAISGLSMGGFSAYNLAAKHPNLYAAAASYSGFPSTQILGLPDFLKYVLNSESGATSADNMWGADPANATWTANNPAAQISGLAGKSLYLSAGTGGNGPYDTPLGFLGLSSNYVGALLEVVANYSSQDFVQVARSKGVNVTTDLTHPGVHDWAYWSDQYKQSWPQLSQALNVTTGFTVQGAINTKWNQLGGAKGFLGNPTSNELDVAGGKVSHFQGGDIYYSNATGANSVRGLIRDKYNALGGPGSSLGFPLTDEYTTPSPDKVGKYNHFQGGYIYYSGGPAAYEVKGAILDFWGSQGYELSRFGFPLSDEMSDGGNGVIQNYQGTNGQFRTIHYVFPNIVP